MPRNDRLRPIIRHDLPAYLVVFLVALPLSLGIAIASNAPVLAGLIAAIVGGIVAGCIGGSPLQVSGPAVGLTVVVADVVAEIGWGAARSGSRAASSGAGTPTAPSKTSSNPRIPGLSRRTPPASD